MKVIGGRSLSAYSDDELVNMLKESSDALTLVYKKHKDYCLNFMRTMYDDRDEIQDIFQDSLIVLYENINKPGFKLTCSIQTYLNSICRNQVLVRLAGIKRHPQTSIEDNEKYLVNITDWFDDSNLVKNERVTVLKGILAEMKENASKCYDILVRFFYQNQTMDKIALALGYTNADNAKNQKYRCQEKLKAELFSKTRR
jgi:RNA polymerase sigma factor (sigma-70 family)